jgi:MoxR-like ATPase
MSTTATTQLDPEALKARIGRFRQVQAEIVTQVRRVIVGQEEVLEQVMIGLFVGGHCLITGLPGTAKTLLVRTMAQTLGLVFKRIQFTPDLMPSDITGTDIIEEDSATGRRTWTFVQGPIFANILLADEINRTPPKTQSALLEAMQERPARCAATTICCRRRSSCWPRRTPSSWKAPTRCPKRSSTASCSIRCSTTSRPTKNCKVVDLTTVTTIPHADPVTNAKEILDFQQLVRMVPIGESVARHAIDWCAPAASRRIGARFRPRSTSTTAPACAPRSSWCWRRRPRR